MTRTRAPLRERTTAASAPLKRVLTGTRTAPAAKRPRAATVHSAQLPHQIATRSPGSTPDLDQRGTELPGRLGQLGVREARRPVAHGHAVRELRRPRRPTMAGMEGQAARRPALALVAHRRTAVGPTSAFENGPLSIQ